MPHSMKSFMTSSLGTGAPHMAATFPGLVKKAAKLVGKRSQILILSTPSHRNSLQNNIFSREGNQ